MSGAAPPCQPSAGRGSVEKTVGLCLTFAWLVNGDAVFVGEIVGGDLVILQEEAFNLALFRRGVAGGVIPDKALALDREAVGGHERQQPAVDCVAGHSGVHHTVAPTVFAPVF